MVPVAEDQCLFRVTVWGWVHFDEFTIGPVSGSTILKTSLLLG